MNHPDNTRMNQIDNTEFRSKKDNTEFRSKKDNTRIR